LWVFLYNLLRLAVALEMFVRFLHVWCNFTVS